MCPLSVISAAFGIVRQNVSSLAFENRYKTFIYIKFFKPLMMVQQV